jgi:hypothetical protein
MQHTSPRKISTTFANYRDLGNQFYLAREFSFLEREASHSATPSLVNGLVVASIHARLCR